MVRGLGVGLGAVAVLGGCADLHRATSLPPVNPESPVAAQVGYAARHSFDTPRLRDVPPIPKDVPEPAAVKSQALAMIRCRGGVESFARTHPALSSGAAQFAATARDTADVNPADVPPPDSAAKTEASAAELRAFAAPPAAINAGPPPTAAEGKPPEAAPPAPASKSARTSPARRAPAAPSTQAAAAPPAAASTAPAATPTSAEGPPPPPPRPDPLLARCS